MGTSDKTMSKDMVRDMLFVIHANNKKEVSAMSTSLLYHAFNIQGVECHSTKYLGNSIIFSAEITDKFRTKLTPNVWHLQFQYQLTD